MSDSTEQAGAAVNGAAAPPHRVGSRAAAGVGGRARPFALLPPDTQQGWTPYAWLVYMGTFFITPVMLTRAGLAPWWLWPATILGTIVFLVTYFVGYWVRGWNLVPVSVIHTALGVAFAPINEGACVFFVYAGSFIGNLDRARNAMVGIVLVAVIGTVTGVVIDAAPFFMFVTIVFTLMVGGVNLHYHQQGRAQNKLRLAHAEIEQLAAIAERERIARDLHDVLGHTLSLIVLKSELAVKLSEIDARRAAREMRDVEDVARRTLHDVRLAIRGYRTTFAEEVDRARSMLKAARIAGGFDVDLVAPPTRIEETLALVLREAVTNVVRHSYASQCDVRLGRDAHAFTLTVHDDGRGNSFAPGLGLIGMRERVEALGGSLTFETGRGTRLCVMIPDLVDAHEPILAQGPIRAMP